MNDKIRSRIEDAVDELSELAKKQKRKGVFLGHEPLFKLGMEAGFILAVEMHRGVVEALKENLVYLAIQNPETKKCDACEPGNAYSPEFICGVHRLIIKTEEALARLKSEMGE